MVRFLLLKSIDLLASRAVAKHKVDLHGSLDGMLSGHSDCNNKPPPTF
jgi:hypothetical protein